MKKGKLDQAAEILLIFKETSEENIDALLRAGIFNDLRDAHILDILTVDRDDIRRALGLKPLVSGKHALFEYVSSVKIPATTERFVAKKEFMVGSMGISGISENFENRFLRGKGKVEEPFPGGDIHSHMLRKGLFNDQIIEGLEGEEKGRTTLTEISALMKRQASKQEGSLLVNGRRNIFLVRDTNDMPCFVSMGWSSGWLMCAYSVGSFGKVPAGYRVFSRDLIY